MNTNFHPNSLPNFRTFSQNPIQTVSQQALNLTNQRIDTDVSTRTVRTNNFPNFQEQKRGVMCNKQIAKKFQRINHLGHEAQQTDFQNSYVTYNCTVGPRSPENQTFAKLTVEDEINFL